MARPPTDRAGTTVGALAEKFLNQTDLAPRSKTAYRLDITAIARRLPGATDDGMADDVTLLTTDGLKEAFTAPGWSTSTRARRWAAWNRFLGWAADQGQIDCNPMAGVPRQAVRRRVSPAVNLRQNRAWRAKQKALLTAKQGPCPDCGRPAWVNPDGGWEHIDGRIRPHTTPTRGDQP